MRSNCYAPRALAALLAIAMLASLVHIACPAKASATEVVTLRYVKNHTEVNGSNNYADQYPKGSAFPALRSPADLGWSSSTQSFKGWGEGVNGSYFSPPQTIDHDIVLYALWEPISAPSTYRVTYNANGGSGSTPQDSTQYSSGATVTLRGNEGNLTRSGYTFAGWSLSASGSVVSQFTITANTVVYASWRAQAQEEKFTVKYDSNGATSGSVPVDSTAYSAGASVNVLGNTGGLLRTGYTFKGFGLSAQGSVVRTLQIASNTTLYAIWERNSLTVRYDLNGGSGTVPVDSTLYAAGDTVTVKSANLTRERYTFKGFSRDKDGNPLQSFSIQAHTTLYAVWKADYYTITYDANGGTGQAPIDTTEYSTGQSAPLKSPGDLKRDGFSFLGWSKTKDGAVITRLTLTSDTTLYAIWANGEARIIYDANGGIGPVPVDTAEHKAGTEFSLEGVGAQGLSRPGYYFAGWALSPEGDPIRKVYLNGMTTLYAVWREGNTFIIQFDGNGGIVNDRDAVRAVEATSPVLGSDMPPDPFRSGFKFKEWNTERDGSGISITQTSLLSSSGIVYAQWQQAGAFSLAKAATVLVSALGVIASGAAAFYIFKDKPIGRRRFRHY